jgi:serine/threonine-protein kinase HipA
MFEVARAHMTPEEALRLFRQVAFNTICCNTDAHAKNFSHSIAANGCAVTPIYDVLCADVYDNVTRNMAQKIAGKSRGDHLRGRHWQRQARACGIPEEDVLRAVGEIAESVLGEADRAMQDVEAMPAGGHPALERVRAAVCRRAINIRHQLTELEPETSEETERATPSP